MRYKWSESLSSRKRYNAPSQAHLGLWKGMYIIPNQSHNGKETGDGTDIEATVS
jgi:hypothetical protein